MTRHRLPIVLTAVLLLGLLMPASGSAGELLDRLLSGNLFGHSGQPPPNAPAVRPVPFAPPPVNVDGRWPGYGFGTPTYNWGYFGARYRKVHVFHEGYYGDFRHWSYAGRK